MRVSGLEKIDEWIGKLRSMDAFVGMAADELAPVVREKLAENFQKGQDPYGSAWPVTQKGERPLKGAADAIEVKAIDNTILITVRDRYMFHTFGAKGLPRRPMLPLGGLPVQLGNAIATGLVGMSEEWLTRPGSHKRFSK